MLDESPLFRKNNQVEKKICETSDIIFFGIDRGDKEKKNKEEKTFEIPFELDLSKYVVDELKNTPNSQFYLNSMIYHRGSYDTGHYVCYVKMKADWYLFNDCSNDYAIKKTPDLNKKDEGGFVPCFLLYCKKGK